MKKKRTVKSLKQIVKENQIRCVVASIKMKFSDSVIDLKNIMQIIKKVSLKSERCVFHYFFC